MSVTNHKIFSYKYTKLSLHCQAPLFILPEETMFGEQGACTYLLVKKYPRASSLLIRLFFDFYREGRVVCFHEKPLT